MSLCKCGCKFVVVEGNNFIHGHNRRGLPSYTFGDGWSMDYEKCVECGTTKLKHAGNGLCSSCYKKYFYNKLKEKWSKKYKKCKVCGRTDRPHKAKGLCGTCYSNKRNHKNGIKKRNFGAWSWYYNKCKKCGTTEREHASNGLCKDCFDIDKRDLTNAIDCPVCGVKVNSINQHLVMRAKKCEKHKQYQYDRFKIYFDSDLGLGDISKELGMDRHAITAQFRLYFGEQETAARNEKVRRCIISDNAIINNNYKNRFGTIVEYKSPNQGEIKLRSKTEARFADSLGDRSWWYERDSFPYIDKEGTRRTYTPDFYLEDEDKYIEVKGKNLLNKKDIHKVGWVREHANISIEIIEM